MKTSAFIWCDDSKKVTASHNTQSTGAQTLTIQGETPCGVADTDYKFCFPDNAAFFAFIDSLDKVIIKVRKLRTEVVETLGVNELQ
jgi:hypothetical protein